MDNKKLIGQRINSALALSGKMQKELAAVLGVTDNTVSYYVGGKRAPNTEQLIVISKYLGVSTDYLLGLSDTPSPDIEDQAICKKLGIDGETLEALKCCFNDLDHGFYDIIEYKERSLYSTFAKLFIISAVDGFPYDTSSFYSRIQECVLDQHEVERLEAEKERKKRVLDGILDTAEETLDENGFRCIVIPDEDEDTASTISGEVFGVLKKLLEATDKRDASEYRLQKSLMELLRKITELWKERYGDTWQA